MIPNHIRLPLKGRAAITNQEHHIGGDIRDCIVSLARRKGRKIEDTHSSMHGILFSVHSLSVVFLAMRNWRFYSQR